jgi:histidinol dehydrogenase
MKHIVWTNLDAPARKTALARPAAISNAALIEGVRAILRDVQDNGDEALSRLTKKFDGRAPDTVEIPISTLEAAWNALPASDQAVIERARRNIKLFHKAQIPAPIEVETEPGVVCRREARAIETAGLYVPGGTAPLISTLLMLAVPAKVAGVRNRIVVTPPGKDGTVNSVILAAAYRCKVSRLFVVGGAQAIGALAYGTNTIPKCDKIFGPGNAWVAAAKSLVAQEAGGPAIDMPAGPSEAMVLADEAADPAFVASDLLSQAEHDTVAQVVCVASTAEMADRIEKEIEAQLKTLPRQAIAREALKHGRMIIANERMDIIDIVNRYAPEHLIVQLRDPDTYVGAIRNAGSIFLGPWTPESVGDYASGTNHTLPTYGAARAYSGVTLESFIKYVSIQKLTKKGLKRLGPVVERLAEMEGLDAHKRAVSLRLEALQ